MSSVQKIRARPWYSSGLWKTQSGWLVFCRECKAPVDAQEHNHNWCCEDHKPRWLRRAELTGAAHRVVARAIRHKQIPAANTLQCADCDKQAEVYDHRDYRKPLEIAAVCRGCNSRRGAGAPYDFLSRQRVIERAKEWAQKAGR